MYKNKKILVCGIARSGIAVAKLLAKSGAIVTIYDKRKIDNTNPIYKELEKCKITIVTSDTPIDIIDEFDFLVVSPGLPLHLDFIQKAFELGKKVVSEIDIANSFTSNTIIGITGTNGKTTCTTLVGEILKYNNIKTKLVGNIGTPFSEEVINDEQGIVYTTELSSYQLESTYDLKPKISIIINFSKDHIERHKTYQNYIDCKKRIYQNSTEDDFLILNYDDPICRQISYEVNNKVVFFSKEEYLPNGVFAKNGYIYSTIGGNEKKVLDLSKVQLLGSHNVENILVAVTTGICMDLNIDKIREGIYSFKGVEHRLEFVKMINGALFMNDSKATNEDATINAINSFDDDIILILGGSKKDVTDYNLIKLIKKKVKHVILIGESKEMLSNAFLSAGYDNFTKVQNLKECIHQSLDICTTGDVVLFSPGYKSFDMFKDFEDRGRKFKYEIEKIGG